MLGALNVLSWILAIEQIPSAGHQLLPVLHRQLGSRADRHQCGASGGRYVPAGTESDDGAAGSDANAGSRCTTASNRVHFGVMFVLNICIGIVHPPIGTNMLITCAARVRCLIGHYTREAVPFPYCPASPAGRGHLHSRRDDFNPSAVFWLDPNPMRTHSNAVTLPDDTAAQRCRRGLARIRFLGARRQVQARISAPKPRRACNSFADRLGYFGQT